MDTGDIIILVTICVATLIDIILKSYFSSKANNLATKEDIQEISFESEKGKNLATKEDIQEITRLAESIKSDVSFENQRKHDFIGKRTELFISILKYAEEINHWGLLMDYYVYTENADEKINSLIQRIEAITTAASYNQYLILVSDKNKDLEDMKPLMEITRVILLYGTEICDYGARAMSIMSRIKGYVDLYTKCNQDQRFMDVAMSVREQLSDLQKETSPSIKYKDEYTKKYMDYLLLLNRLYDKDFNINLNYNQPPQ